MTAAIRQFLSRLLALVRRKGSDAGLDEEIRAHLDLLSSEHVRRGLSRVEARAAARRDFGGVDQMKELYRDQRAFAVVDAVAQDVRYAFSRSMDASKLPSASGPSPSPRCFVPFRPAR